MHPFARAGVAPSPFAGFQLLLLAFLYLISICVAGEEVVSPREEDCGADEEDTVEGWEFGAGVVELLCSFLVVGCRFLVVGCRFLEALYAQGQVHCSYLEV